VLLAPTLFAALQDVPQRVVIERGGLENAALVGQAITSLLVLVLLVAASLTLFALRRALDELTRLVRSTSSDITAAVHDAREVADELRRLTGRVRDTADIVRSGAQKVRRMVERSGSPAAPAVEASDEDSTDARERPEASRERSERRRRKRRRPGDRPRREDGGSDGPPAAAGPADE
jgi:methyl-accepting chemotaxis protein